MLLDKLPSKRVIKDFSLLNNEIKQLTKINHKVFVYSLLGGTFIIILLTELLIKLP